MIAIDVALALARFTLRVAVELPEGITAVIGPSGAGKTSLLEAVAGLRPATRGRIVVGGDVLLDDARGIRLPPERRRIGYVPQDAGLFPHLTAYDNLRFGARGDGERLRAAIDALQLGGLLARFPATLSGGERQRVALARALATAPRLLLLDEPLAALDVDLRDRILPYLLHLREAWAVPILYVTHNVGEALAVADHALAMDAGAVAAHGAPLALVASPVLAREAEAGIENVVAGRVARHDEAGGITEVALADGVRLACPLAASLPAGTRVVLSVRADDILLATAPPHGVSARNVVAARIERCERVGRDVLVRCAADAGGPPWLVRITPAAASALALAPGGAVWLAIKSHSIRI